jgi:hypothetical protein
MMKSCQIILFFTTICLLGLLSACGGTEADVQAPTLPNTPMQTLDISPTLEIGDTGVEMNISSLTLPVGDLPVIDGSLSPGEWDGAALETFADGSQLFLMQADGQLFLGIRANEPEMIAANVFVYRGDEISILHSSAALGTAIYQPGGNGWQQAQNFNWRCRDVSNSESARAERDVFFQEEGWLACNSFIGTPNELEYRIKITRQDFRLAVVIIRTTPPNEKIPWPVDLDDDCIKSTPGGLPPIMQFSPDAWVMIHAGGE